MEKTHSVTKLLEYLGISGLPCSRTWIYTLEKQGKLVCPRRPNSRRDRVFTDKQMDEIKIAFSVGGKGYWRYK